VTWLIHMCDITRLFQEFWAAYMFAVACLRVYYVWHDEFNVRDMTNSYLWHGSFIRVTWLSQEYWAADVFAIACFHVYYGVATISRMLKNIGLFCNRDLQKRPIFCKETYIFKHPTHRSHPIRVTWWIQRTWHGSFVMKKTHSSIWCLFNRSLS